MTEIYAAKLLTTRKKTASQTFSYKGEQHVLVGADFEVSRKTDGSSADVPEENAEGIDVDAVIILAGDKLRRHV